MIRIAIAALALAGLLAVPAFAEAGSAAETVKGYYVPTIWNPLELEGLAGLAEPALSILRKNAEQSGATGEVGCIDVVPTIDAQDYDDAEIARSLEVEDAGTTKDGATLVSARFTLFAEPREIVWTMREDGGVWKVSDIESKSGRWRLSEFLCE